MGVNALRTAHNPPAPEMIEVCEELGIVVMVEAFDTWRSPRRRSTTRRFFDADSDASTSREMVDAAKNSPAVIMWSIGNEIRGSDRAAAAMAPVWRESRRSTPPGRS